MKITNNYSGSITNKARIVVLKDTRNSAIVLKPNKHSHKHTGILSKLITKIIKPYLKPILKDPS